jgi:Domain of unknown function (DUF4760)
VVAAVPVELVNEGTDWAAWIAAGATALTALVVFVTAIAALMALGDAKRTRHGLLITEIEREWTAAGVVDSRMLSGEYSEKGIVALIDKLFGPGDEKPTEKELADFSTLALVPNLIESMGVLVSEEAITNEVVYKMWGGPILSAWDTWQDAITKLREHDGQPDTFEYFEALARAMRKINEERKQRKASGGPAASSGPRVAVGSEPGTNAQKP